MSEEQKVLLATMLTENDPEATEDVIKMYLRVAANMILQRLYPHGIPPMTILPNQYDVMQCELAARQFLRRGGQGETSHSENGISRTYGSADDSDILDRIVPFVNLP
ncbi:MAG: phage head-tail connector protein [Lachnospiraceae bacterium]|nr:phage head-tail connector protein [Lachnospiraceae bacterium]